MIQRFLSYPWMFIAMWSWGAQELQKWTKSFGVFHLVETLWDSKKHYWLENQRLQLGGFARSLKDSMSKCCAPIANPLQCISHSHKAQKCSTEGSSAWCPLIRTLSRASREWTLSCWEVSVSRLLIRFRKLATSCSSWRLLAELFSKSRVKVRLRVSARCNSSFTSVCFLWNTSSASCCKENNFNLSECLSPTTITVHTSTLKALYNLSECLSPATIKVHNSTLRALHNLSECLSPATIKVHTSALRALHNLSVFISCHH